MTYLQIINLIKDTALAQPNVNTFVRQFIDLNREDTKYSAVVLQDRDGLRDRISEQDWNTYTFHLGYVDRLTYDESNRDDIFSTGINIINNIVASIRNVWFPDVEVNIIDRFNTFDQRFTASCAGVYVVLAIQVPVSDCVDPSEGSIYDTLKIDIDDNGHYHYEDERPYGDVDINVNVSDKKPEVELEDTIWVTPYTPRDYTWTPPEGYVYSSAHIDVVCNEGSLLETITSNGEYHYEPAGGSSGIDMYNEVNLSVDVHPSTSLSAYYTENGVYTIADEFNGGRIDVDVFVPVADPGYVYVSQNGTQDIYPEHPESEVFSYMTVVTDVHPSTSLVESITSNGSYHYTGEWKDADITVAVSAAKPEESLSETITSNGSYSYSPTPGSVFSSVALSVDVHPSNTLSRSYTTNGQKTITGEFNGGTINISVHPSQKLVQTITVNGLTSLSGEWTDADITVSIPDGSFPEPGSDEIYYITYTGNVLDVFDHSDFDTNFVSNTYDSTRGFCVLKFDGPITKVGDNAFNNKPQLKKMRLPDSVTRIGSQSFKDSGIIEIQMDGVVRIDYAAFYNSYAQVTPLTIPEGCETITNNAYAYCTAAAIIEIPSTVNFIGHTAFRYCSNLELVYLYATVPPVLEDDNGTYDQFFDTDSNMTIVVPSGTLSTYQNAAGWSTYASRIVER